MFWLSSAWILQHLRDGCLLPWIQFNSGPASQTVPVLDTSPSVLPFQTVAHVCPSPALTNLMQLIKALLTSPMMCRRLLQSSTAPHSGNDNTFRPQLGLTPASKTICHIVCVPVWFCLCGCVCRPAMWQYDSRQERGTSWWGVGG